MVYKAYRDKGKVEGFFYQFSVYRPLHNVNCYQSLVQNTLISI